jgi:hypothetical protein
MCLMRATMKTSGCLFAGPRRGAAFGAEVSAGRGKALWEKGAGAMGAGWSRAAARANATKCLRAISSQSVSSPVWRER